MHAITKCLIRNLQMNNSMTIFARDINIMDIRNKDLGKQQGEKTDTMHSKTPRTKGAHYRDLSN